MNPELKTGLHRAGMFFRGLLYVLFLTSLFLLIYHCYDFHSRRNWHIAEAEITFIGILGQSSAVDIWGTYTDYENILHEDVLLYHDVMFYHDIDEAEQHCGETVRILYDTPDGIITGYEKMLDALFGSAMLTGGLLVLILLEKSLLLITAKHLAKKENAP